MFKKSSFSFCLTFSTSLGLFEAPRIQFHVVSYFKSRPEQIDRKSVLWELKLPVECLCSTKMKGGCNTTDTDFLFWGGRLWRSVRECLTIYLDWTVMIIGQFGWFFCVLQFAVNSCVLWRGGWGKIVAGVVLRQSSSCRMFYGKSSATCKSAHSLNTTKFLSVKYWYFEMIELFQYFNNLGECELVH